MGYGEILKKHWVAYLIEFVIAIILVNWDIKVFLVVAFFTVSLEAIAQANLLRKLIRALSFSNEIKLAAIVKKLKISDEEIDEAVKRAKVITPQEKWEQFEKDWKDISR